METAREELINTHNEELDREKKHYAKVLADNQMLEEKILSIKAKLSGLEEVQAEKNIVEAELAELRSKFSHLTEEKTEADKKMKLMEKSLVDEHTRNATLDSQVEILRKLSEDNTAATPSTAPTSNSAELEAKVSNLQAELERTRTEQEAYHKNRDDEIQATLVSVLKLEPFIKEYMSKTISQVVHSISGNFLLRHQNAIQAAKVSAAPTTAAPTVATSTAAAPTSTSLILTAHLRQMIAPGTTAPSAVGEANKGESANVVRAS